MICSNCGSAAEALRRTWCRPCYLRWVKAGKPESGPPPLQNDTLIRWREIVPMEIGREPTDLDVGTAGEHIVCANLLLMGFAAFRTDQICAYDVAVDLGGRLIRLQVKSTRAARPVPQRQGDGSSAYRWHVRRAGKGGRRKYGDDEFDLYALVALDIRQVAYVPPSHTQTIFDIWPAGSSGDRQFPDYPFGRALTVIEVLP